MFPSSRSAVSGTSSAGVRRRSPYAVLVGVFALLFTFVAAPAASAGVPTKTYRVQGIQVAEWLQLL